MILIRQKPNQEFIPPTPKLKIYIVLNLQKYKSKEMRKRKLSLTNDSPHGGRINSCTPTLLLKQFYQRKSKRRENFCALPKCLVHQLDNIKLKINIYHPR